jgi:hypothetical protein
MEELLKLLGFTTPFMYATAAYAFFHWLDENASDEAKAALARTMSFKNYKNEQIASALVEVFDRIYTYPLLRWRAFFRSLLFTAVVSVVFVLEWTHLHDLSLMTIQIWWPLLFLHRLPVSVCDQAIANSKRHETGDRPRPRYCEWGRNRGCGQFFTNTRSFTTCLFTRCSR